MSQIDSTSPFLPLPDGIVIASVHAETSHIIVHVRGTHPTAACPLCGQRSERVHGNYARTVADLPCGGRRVILSLTVRKFVCGTSNCLRKIFTERIDSLVQSYARMTNRLSETLQTLGFATCGELGERVAPKLGRPRFWPHAPAANACPRLHSSKVCVHFGHRRLGMEERNDLWHDFGRSPKSSPD